MFIRVFIEKYTNKIRDEVLFEINNVFYPKYGSKLKINYLSSEQYWKIPEFTEVIFELTIPTVFSIKDFTSTFHLNWLYRTSKYLDKKENIILSENAIWDKATHNGSFLHKNIIWAKIYNIDK